MLSSLTKMLSSLFHLTLTRTFALIFLGSMCTRIHCSQINVSMPRIVLEKSMMSSGTGVQERDKSLFPFSLNVVIPVLPIALTRNCFQST